MWIALSNCCNVLVEVMKNDNEPQVLSKGLCPKGTCRKCFARPKARIAILEFPEDSHLLLAKTTSIISEALSSFGTGGAIQCHCHTNLHSKVGLSARPGTQMTCSSVRTVLHFAYHLARAASQFAYHRSESPRRQRNLTPDGVRGNMWRGKDNSGLTRRQCSRSTVFEESSKREGKDCHPADEQRASL